MSVVCSSTATSILSLKSLLKIVRHNVVFKDVYREVGIVEVMASCLKRLATLLKDPKNADGE